MTVAASPFNGVKLELGLIFVVAVVYLLVIDRLVNSPLHQLLWLTAYGLGASAWLVFRIRRILRQIQSDRQHLKSTEQR